MSEVHHTERGESLRLVQAYTAAIGRYYLGMTGEEITNEENANVDKGEQTIKRIREFVGELKGFKEPISLDDPKTKEKLEKISDEPEFTDIITAVIALQRRLYNQNELWNLIQILRKPFGDNFPSEFGSSPEEAERIVTAGFDAIEREAQPEVDDLRKGLEPFVEQLQKIVEPNHSGYTDSSEGISYEEAVKELGRLIEGFRGFSDRDGTFSIPVDDDFERQVRVAVEALERFDRKILTIQDVPRIVREKIYIQRLIDELLTEKQQRERELQQ